MTEGMMNILEQIKLVLEGQMWSPAGERVGAGTQSPNNVWNPTQWDKRQQTIARISTMDSDIQPDQPISQIQQPYHEPAKLPSQGYGLKDINPELYRKRRINEIRGEKLAREKMAGGGSIYKTPPNPYDGLRDAKRYVDLMKYYTSLGISPQAAAERSSDRIEQDNARFSPSPHVRSKSQHNTVMHTGAMTQQSKIDQTAVANALM